jgi:hypothetical protein
MIFPSGHQVQHNKLLILKGCKQDKVNNLITLSKMEQITHYKIVEHWMFSFQWSKVIYIYTNVH